MSQNKEPHSKQQITTSPPESLVQEGLTAFQKNDFATAERKWREALNHQPDHQQLRVSLGLALKQQGKQDDAIAVLSEGRRPGHDSAELYSNLANLLIEKGRYQEALEATEAALRINERLGPAHINQAIALVHLDRHQDAIAKSQHCLTMGLNCAEVHIALGAGLHGIGDFQGAADQARHAITQNPNSAAAHSNLGQALLASGERTQAIECFKQCLALNPQYVVGLVNLGLALFQQQQFDAAIDAYRQALKWQPDQAEAHANLAIALQEIGEFSTSIEHFEHAIQLKPAYAEAHFGLATSLLMQEKWQSGWFHYSWRFAMRHQTMTITPEHLPQANQQKLDRETRLLVVHEQGLGDSLQFCRHLPALAERCKHVQFAVPNKLHALLDQADLKAELLPFPAVEPIQADAWLPLLDLPALLNSDLEANQAPYLTADPVRCSHWQQRLQIPGQRLIGLCWQGNPEQELIPGRSVALEAFAPLAAIPGVQLLSLQRGAGEEQLQSCSFADQFVPQQAELNQIWDFAEIAGMMHACERIITVDTAVAHLAGGLGLATSLLLKQVPDWRWGLEGTSTPLYPSMRLYRQPRRGDWTSVINALVQDLRKP